MAVPTYEPGKPYISGLTKDQIRFSPTDAFNQPRGYRTLTADEFNYYYSFLDSDTLSEPQKVGVAVVLWADMKRWAGIHQDVLLRENTRLKEMVQKFIDWSEGSSEKSIAQEEIKNFDMFLQLSEPARAKRHASIEEARKEFAVRMNVAAIEERKKAAAESLLSAEDELRLEKEQVEFMKEQANIVASALEAHARANIRRYLAGLFNQSLAKYFVDNHMAELEFKARMKIINDVEANKIRPLVGIATYQKVLNKIPETSSWSVLESIINTETKNFLHPMSKGFKMSFAEYEKQKIGKEIFDPGLRNPFVRVLKSSDEPRSPITQISKHSHPLIKGVLRT